MMKNLRNILNEIEPSSATPGDVIRAFRKNFNITHEELCEVTGLKRPNLSALENGRIEMTVHYAEILGAALGIHPSTILFPNGRYHKSKEIRAIEKRAEALMKKKKNGR